MQCQQVIAGAILVIMLGCSCVSALKCYKCDSTSSPASCTNSLFIPLTVEVQSDCTCCTKHVTASVTTRECVSSLMEAGKCIPLGETNLVCKTDNCNTGSVLTQSFLAVFLAAAAVLGAVMRL